MLRARTRSWLACASCASTGAGVFPPVTPVGFGYLHRAMHTAVKRTNSVAFSASPQRWRRIAVSAYSAFKLRTSRLGEAAGPIRRGNSGITGAQTYQVAGSGSGSDRYRLRRRRRSGGRWSTADRHPHARHDVGRTNRHDDDTAANGADDKGCPGYDSDSSQRLLTQAAISSSSGGSWRKQH
jgi:hypothetical protein